MDFNEIAEGATVYLPVVNSGALLYLGDAHAARATASSTATPSRPPWTSSSPSTSSPTRISALRVETPTHIMAPAYSGSLDDAFHDATANMAKWLDEDTVSTPPSSPSPRQCRRIRVSEVADRNSGIALKINKTA